MAIITKIRNQSALLIGAIGIAMLLFIVGGDMLSSGGGFFGGGPETTLAEIKGKKISFQEFDARVKSELIRQYGTESVEEEVREAVRQRVWTKLLHEEIMFNEYDKLGIGVSAEELFYQIQSPSPSPVLTQVFTNPQTGRIYDDFRDPITGGLNAQRVTAYIQQEFFDKQNLDAWVPIENAIKLDRLSTKYFNLAKKGLYVTTVQAKHDYISKNKKIDISYVLNQYSDLPDADVPVTVEEMKTYYGEHKEEPQYQQPETTRSIQYVVFRIIPDREDTLAALNEIEALKQEFSETENDTFFVQRFATNPQISWKSKAELPEELDSAIMAADTGEVFGPYLEEGSYKLSKAVDFKMASDSAHARHILLKMPQGDTASAKAMADSLKQVTKEQGNFEELAQKYSQDFASAQEGGDLGWFTEGTMVKPVNDAVFEGEEGDMPIVVTQFGVHLIEILEKSEPVKKVLLATVDLPILAGDETYDEAYNEASAFSINNNNPEKFKEAGNQLGIRQADNITKFDKRIPGLPQSRQLIQWIYKAEKGDVSEPFELENQYVVALLTEIKPEGTLPFEVVKETVREELIKEKKAQRFIEKMSGKGNLEAVAEAVDASIETADNISFAYSSIPGVGPERKVIGRAAALNVSEISDPVKGNSGVFVMRADNLEEAPETTNYAFNKQQLSRAIQGRVDIEVFEALKEEADIVDNRPLFY